jgi:hypothetical protein
MGAMDLLEQHRSYERKSKTTSTEGLRAEPMQAIHPVAKSDRCRITPVHLVFAEGIQRGAANHQ